MCFPFCRVLITESTSAARSMVVRRVVGKKLKLKSQVRVNIQRTVAIVTKKPFVLPVVRRSIHQSAFPQELAPKQVAVAGDECIVEVE